MAGGDDAVSTEEHRQRLKLLLASADLPSALPPPPPKAGDWQGRLVTEYVELHERVAKLRRVVATPPFKGLGSELLPEQLGHMEGYLKVLSKRMELLGLL